LLAPSFGDLATVEGERADLVVIARTGGGRPDEMLVVPRDIVIDGGEGPAGRLAVDWRDGPQAFVDRLCLGTGLPVDHLVALDAESLVRLVDASGGLDVNVVNRIRDPRSKLAPIGPGQVRLDGLEALAWVRSRNPEVLTPDGWRPIAVPAKGSLLRNERTPAVIRSVTSRMVARPWSSLPALPGIADTVRVDESLGLMQVAGLARDVRGIPVVIPEVDQGAQRTPSARLTPEGEATVAEFIGDERCSPSPS
jgi:LCP family protein required for cell wall assembly